MYVSEVDHAASSDVHCQLMARNEGSFLPSFSRDDLRFNLKITA